jgi:hypothetical protein
MRAKEFLQSLIDVLDTLESEEETTKQPPVVININSDEGSTTVDTDSEEITPDNTGKFIPPLQQNIEILKKNAGIKSAFDQEASNNVIPGP